jgi:hypothetical protein
LRSHEHQAPQQARPYTEQHAPRQLGSFSASRMARLQQDRSFLLLTSQTGFATKNSSSDFLLVNVVLVVI